MVRTRALVVGPVLLAALLGPAVGLRAEEGRPAPLILNIVALPMEKPEAAFQESLRSTLPARVSGDWQMLPDGSASYGNGKLRVVIRNPCPEGSVHTPVALPGRSRR